MWTFLRGAERMRTLVKTNVLCWLGAGLLAAGLSFAHAAAEETCGLCAKQIVTNSELASCFLDQYDQIAKSGNEAVVVDLSGCASRGVVEALPSPNKAPAEPDVQFMISRLQLDCLKKKLEAPGVVLDPSATIDLDSCR